MRASLLALAGTVAVAALGGCDQSKPGPQANRGVFAVDSTSDASVAVLGRGVCVAAGGGCTLRAAVEEAAVAAGAVTINLPAGHYTLGRALAPARGRITVTGAGPAATVIDAATKDRAFDLAGAGSLTLKNLTVTRGRTGQEGGAIRVYGADLTLDTVAVASSGADGNGGALFADGSKVIVRNSTFASDNALAGGAIAVSGGDLSVTGATFTSGLAADVGGAIYVAAGRSLVITGTTFTSNSAEHSGGALFLASAVGTPVFSVTSSHFITDSALGGSGGALASDGLLEAGGATAASLLISGSSFTGNFAEVAGGAICSPATLSSRSNTFTGNKAPDGPDTSATAPS